MIKNRRAYFDYTIIETLEVGLVLTGAQTKAIKNGQINIDNAFGKLTPPNIFLINAKVKIPGEEDSTPPIKLLLHKNQIRSLSHQLSVKNLNLIPLSVYNKGRLVKLNLALAKSNKKHEKRDIIKKRDINRELQTELKDSKY